MDTQNKNKNYHSHYSPVFLWVYWVGLILQLVVIWYSPDINQALQSPQLSKSVYAKTSPTPSPATTPVTPTHPSGSPRFLLGL